MLRRKNCAQGQPALTAVTDREAEAISGGKSTLIPFSDSTVSGPVIRPVQDAFT